MITGSSVSKKVLLICTISSNIWNAQGEIKICFVLQGHEPFVSYEGLEQLHRFIFVMAVTHVSYSCLTMLLAIVKVNHSFKIIIMANMTQKFASV